jgi:hypothetical protein
VVEDQPTPGPKELMATELRPVFGEYVPTDFSGREHDGFDGTDADPPGPFATLPAVSGELAQMIAQVPADEPLRVIVMLRHLPHDRISAEVNARHAAERAAIEEGVDGVLASAAARRDPTMLADGENYGELIRTLPQEREALRTFNEQLEALGLVVKNELSAELSAELAPYVARVRSEIERLGGGAFPKCSEVPAETRRAGRRPG